MGRYWFVGKSTETGTRHVFGLTLKEFREFGLKHKPKVGSKINLDPKDPPFEITSFLDHETAKQLEAFEALDDEFCDGTLYDLIDRLCRKVQER